MNGARVTHAVSLAGNAVKLVIWFGTDPTVVTSKQDVSPNDPLLLNIFAVRADVQER
jgi:hypothetical protein